MIRRPRRQASPTTRTAVPGEETGPELSTLDWGDAASHVACTEAWAEAALEALRLEAEAIASRFLARWLLERQRRPKSQWGRVGVRVRRLTSGRAPPGAFAIEWFRFQWVRAGAGRRVFTTYLARGPADRYPPAAFRRAAQPWELAFIEAAEDDFARIRALAHSIGRVRRQAKLHAHLERSLRLASPGKAADRDG